MEKINIQQIKEVYPLAIKKLKEYASPIIWYGMTEEDLKAVENTEEVEDIFVEAIVVNNPRFLYDFFDKEGVYIGIDRDGEEFSSSVDTIPVTVAETRAEVEQAAFMSAFEKLNSK